MKSLFVTALPNLQVNEAGRGFALADGLFLTSRPNDVAPILTEAFRRLAGSLAVDSLLQSNAIVYAHAELDLSPDPSTTAARYIDCFLRTINMFSMALWLIKDNAVDSPEGYLQYVLHLHPSRIYVSNHSLGIFYWDASGQRNPAAFSSEELRSARNYLETSLERLGLPKGTTSTSPSLPANVPRLGRVWYFIENARMNSDLAIKIATYVTCLEALLSTDSLELAHKLSERLALFIASSAAEQQSIYERAKLAYSIRSKTLHGDDLSSKQRQTLGEIARYCDEYLRRCVLKALSSDGTAALFNGKKERLEEYMLKLLFRVPQNSAEGDIQPEPESNGAIQEGGK